LVSNRNQKLAANTSGNSQTDGNEIKTKQQLRGSSSTSKSNSEKRYTLRCSFLQIYQESVLDLLAESLPQGRAPPPNVCSHPHRFTI
jgi:hypothetical protein